LAIISSQPDHPAPSQQQLKGPAALETSDRRTPMPKFVIERKYLLPIYQRLIIDAPDIATACQGGGRE
jgi:hypothetical protein